jgi:glyoxylase-like metal-dependent hydrolase (beta-lactamase superfamily II)
MVKSPKHKKEEHAMRIFLIVALQLTFIVSGFPQTTQNNVYEVYAIEYGSSNGHVPLKAVAVNAASDDSTTFSFYIWLLRGANGRCVLVDTGFLEDTTGSSPRLTEYQRPDLALQRIGVNANDITDIVITHPHYDHIGGLELFKKGTIWMQLGDYAYFVGGAWQAGINNRGLDKRDVLNIVQANLDGRLRLVNGDSLEIIPGIRVFIGSKHSYESQHLLVNTSTEKVLIASDDSWFYYNIQNLLSVPLTFDTDAYVKELRRMKTLVSNPDLIIPGHDALVLSKFPTVAKGVVRIR